MKTILYYTSNRENPLFENNIIRVLIRNSGDLPIVSVSQKPMYLGKNICVGDVGHSYLNLYRQQLIGAKQIETDYIVFAESDFIYPEEYFNFVPGDDNVYLCNNTWILFKRYPRYYRKKGISHGAQIVKREHLIERLERGLEGLPEWYDGMDVPWLSLKQRRFVTRPVSSTFGTNIACVSFKTFEGLNNLTKTMKGKGTAVRRLPYWGRAKDLADKLL